VAIVLCNRCSAGTPVPCSSSRARRCACAEALGASAGRQPPPPRFLAYPEGPRDGTGFASGKAKSRKQIDICWQASLTLKRSGLGRYRFWKGNMDECVILGACDRRDDPSL